MILGSSSTILKIHLTCIQLKTFKPGDFFVYKTIIIYDNVYCYFVVYVRMETKTIDHFFIHCYVI
jgi:hypothetical protein